MRSLAFTLIWLATVTSAAIGKDEPKPVKAEIVDVPAQRKDWHTPLGNVKVFFDNGRSEMWTKRGQCNAAEVSASGLVGWTYFKERNAFGEPLSTTLRIISRGKFVRDFQATPRSYIAWWFFVDEDRAIVMKTAYRHGSFRYAKYDIYTGKLMAVVEDYAPYEKLPDWAKPFADDKPVTAPEHAKPKN